MSSFLKERRKPTMIKTHARYGHIWILKAWHGMRHVPRGPGDDAVGIDQDNQLIRKVPDLAVMYGAVRY